MIGSGNFPGNSARFYGLNSVESTPSFGLGSRPIITYGSADFGNFGLNSTESFTIQANLSLEIEVTTQPGLTQRLQPGWIIEMYGGNQRANSTTAIELKSQENLSIQFVAGQTGRTFRVGQVVDIRLNTDPQKYMLATVKTFNASTALMVVDVIAHEGSGTYPQVGGQNWVITVSDVSTISADYMLARISDIVYPTSSGQPIRLTFQSYQAYGQGTYAQWLITPQWEKAFNLVRNLNHSAFSASRGPSTGIDEPYAAATFVPFTGNQTVTNVVTSDTPFLKTGYTQVVASGFTRVYEDEHDIHRPYMGRTVTANGYMETVIVTTTTTYDQYLNPTSVTTTETSQAPLSRSHTFSASDYVPDDQPGVKYFSGSPAVYSNGQLVSAPTPSYYVRDDQGSGSITYLSTQYERVYQTFEFGDPPVEYILQTLDRTIGKATFITGYDRPNPEGFFYPP